MQWLVSYTTLPFRSNWRMTWSWRSIWPPSTATCWSTIFAGKHLGSPVNHIWDKLSSKLTKHLTISFCSLRIIEPYSKVQVDYVASKIGLPKTEVVWSYCARFLPISNDQMVTLHWECGHVMTLIEFRWRRSWVRWSWTRSSRGSSTRRLGCSSSLPRSPGI